MSLENVDFFVSDTSPAKLPVPGVAVKILSADGAIFYSLVTTDSLGHAGFLLPSGFPYQARFYKFAAGFVNPQLFSVLPSPLSPGQSNAFQIPATLLTPPIPRDSRLCTAYGYFRDITGAPQSDVLIHFIAAFNPVWLDGSAVLKERVIVRTDANGYAEVNLIRNGQYNVLVGGAEDMLRKVSIPDAPNVNLPDLLFPIVSRIVTVPAAPIALRVGQSLLLSVHVYASDGEDLGVGSGDVLYSSSDPNVLGYSLSPLGLTLQGITPGVASIKLTRLDQSIVHIPDPGILGQPLLVTVSP